MLTGLSPFSRRLIRLLALGVAAPMLGTLALGSGLPTHAAAAAVTTPAALAQACATALQADDKEQLQLLQRQLLQRPAQPESLAPLLDRARALLLCRAPDGALAVLDRISPAPGAERRPWLVLRWQAAAAGLDHRIAVESLEQLAEGDRARLETVELELPPTAAGAVVRRRGLDLLADHLEALGWRQRAATALLSGTAEGEAGAVRLGRAVELARDLPAPQRQALLERALEQAAAAGSWGLVAQLLDQQWMAEATLSADDLAVVRRLRLSGRIDDAYGEWRLRRRLPDSQPRLEELERQLASPQAPGGHAAQPVSRPVP